MMSKRVRGLATLLGLAGMLLPGAPGARGESHPGAAVTVSRTAHALDGPLRVCGPSYCDDTGPRTVYFVSWFPALWAWKYDREAAVRQLDAIAEAGWQGVRLFHAVGGWDRFWAGREIAPVRFQTWLDWGRPAGRWIDAWPDYDEQLRTFLQAAGARGLRVSLTSGDMQFLFASGGQLDHFRRVARLAAEAGDVVAIFELWNEGFQNGGDPDAGAAYIAELRPLLPQVLFVNSAPPAVTADELRTWSQGADIVAVHGRRTPLARAIADVFDLVHGPGRPAVPDKPYAQTEPVGPDAAGEREVYLEDEVYRGEASHPSWLWGLYAMHVMSGQATVFFNGPAVRWQRPLEETWGFVELPRLLAEIPRDVGQWRQAGGPEAPLYVSASPGRDGTPPMRIDQVSDGRRMAALIYGGSGRWHVAARRAMRYRVVSHSGEMASGRVEAGDELPGGFWHADRRAVLVLATFDEE